jgi:hypothetical protein
VKSWAKNVKQNQKLVTPRGKGEKKMKWPTVSSPSYETKVGLDPGLQYLFVAKNNINKVDRNYLPKKYYHESKLKWNITK